MGNAHPPLDPSRAGHTGEKSPRRRWSTDEIREVLRLDNTTLSNLARDWRAMSPSERQAFYRAIAIETRRRRIPRPRIFADGVVQLLEIQAARDARGYSLTVGPMTASGPDPLAVLLLAIGGAAIWVGARHVDRALAASVLTR
jgi:hypothetical protein